MIKRKDVYVLWDCTDGLPNGDPNADNRPRLDYITNQGIVTDACIKRKIRNYWALVNGDDCLYIRERGVLAPLHKKAYDSLGLSPSPDSIKPASAKMCEDFTDVRTFGALMNMGKVDVPEEDEEVPEDGTKTKGKKDKKKTPLYDCGAVRGPVQISFSRTIDPVEVNEIALTRTALTNKDEGAGSHLEDGELVANSGTMAPKYTISYGLYGFTININPIQAAKSGYSDADDALFFDALTKMFENDASAARVAMYVRKVYVFTHDSELGNAPRHKLFERIKVAKNAGVESPRKFSDYTIDVDTANMPEGVKLTELMDGLA